MTLAGWILPASLLSADSKDPLNWAPGGDRSQHFAAVAKNLELGGTMFGYVDLDGDTAVVAESLRKIFDQLATAQPMMGSVLKQDYAKIFEDLGFSDVKAFGLSSVEDPKGGYRNRVFIYMPNGRHGLWAGLGGEAAPYVYTKNAPADTDLYGEGEIDFPAIYAAVKAVVTRVGGTATANMMDSQLQTAGAQASVSAFDVIQSFRGRCVAVLKVDPEKNLTFPGAEPLVVPAFSLLLRVDGVGASLEKALSSAPVFNVTQEKGLKIFSFKEDLPVQGLKPVFAIEDRALYVATSIGFLQEFRERKAGLDQNPDFQRLLASVGPAGNGVCYASPRLFSRLQQLASLNPAVRPDTKNMLQMLTTQIPTVAQPVMAERVNLPDGVLIRSQWFRSLKQDVAMIAVYNPVTLGMIAAMAVPAFNKVRTQSQETAIHNNLRQFVSAAQQYMLETGKDSASYEDVVGPEKYVHELKPVSGENYEGLVIHNSDTSVSVETADGKSVTYDW